MLDIIIKNGLVVDGTGAPARRGDVGIVDGRIAAVGRVDDEARETIDATGMVVAPGFIDIHTHYDAQILWDPDLTPSSWHGVTTAVMGNCGFGIAPTRPEHRATIAQTLENVEGMSVAALEAGIPWDFETFPEYLDVIDRTPKRLNVAVMLGHTPLRLYHLGEAAVERPATLDEIAVMRKSVDEALEAGAIGFATSKSTAHTGAQGRPVPSRFAELDEIAELTGALGAAGRGILQATTGPGLFFNEFAELSRATGRPVTWTALLTGMKERGKALELVDRTEAAGGSVWPQIACRPVVMQITLEDPYPFFMAAAFKEVLAVPAGQRAELYTDPAWRARAREEMNRDWSMRWPRTSVMETEVHGALVGRPLSELAIERGVDPLDLIVDLALEEDLRTRFLVILGNDDEEELAELLLDTRCILGLSDAGAHASQLCDACFSSHLLGYWVRERQVLSVEQAVWRLTGQPAEIFGFGERGRLAVGYHADVVVFDPDTVGVEKMERVWDLPAGADRLVAYSEGIRDVFVGGTAVRRAGSEIPDSRPGLLLRAGA